MTVKELKRIISAWDDCDTLYVQNQQGQIFYLGFPEYSAKDGWSHVFKEL